MTNYGDVILWLAVSYALLGALLLAILTRARLSWPIKASLIAADKRVLRREFLRFARSARLVVDRSAAAAVQAARRAHRGAPLARGRRRGDPPLGGGTGQGQFSKRRAARLPSSLRRQARGKDRGGDQGERRGKASGRPDRGFRDGRRRRGRGDRARGHALVDHHDRRRRSLDRRFARSGRRRKAIARASSSRRLRLRACRPKSHSKRSASPPRGLRGGRPPAVIG